MIWCIGESLYDIVFEEHTPRWAVPGGSMLNAAVSAARAGEEVSLISELGNDAIGDNIRAFLTENGISTSLIAEYSGNTTLALAFLNQQGDARYQFYHTSPAQAPAFKVPAFAPGDVLMFGSFYSISPRNRSNITTLATAARAAGAVVYYDPNFRKPHLHQLQQSLPFIRENIALAHLVRGSDEDFGLIAGTQTPADTFDFIRHCGGQALIYTRNRQGSDLFANGLQKHYHAIETEVVSTIGAGDSFNAGMAVSIHRKGNLTFTEADWDEAMERAVIFATEVCGSRNNFINRKK